MDEKEILLREEMAANAKRSIEGGDVTGWFEELYQHADGDIDVVPWLDLEPNRFLVEWDNGSLDKGKGRSALVVGCGIGDEAFYLEERGWKVTGFDVSPTAIEWAKKLSGEREIDFFVEDMFAPTDRLKKHWDLVIEVYTIQALPVEVRERAIDAIAGFVGKGGELIAVQRLRRNHDQSPDGPPWAVSKRELERFETHDLNLAEFNVLLGSEEEPIERFVVRYLNT